MEFLADLPRYIAIAAFVVFFFGFCVFIHELGHLLVALWRGLHVEAFSIGFGKELWGKTYKGVRYKISLLPFGGYVELPQLETAEEWKDSKGNKLPAVKPIDRMLTAFAGPLFNILFGFALGSVIWIVGINKPVPADSLKVAFVKEQSPEKVAGLQVGDEIVKVNGETFSKGFSEIFERIILTTTEKVSITFIRGGETKTISYVPAESEDPRFEGLGAPQFTVETGAQIKALIENSPAEKAGLKVNDIVLTVNGQKVVSHSDFIKKIKALSGKSCELLVERGEETITIKSLKPEVMPMYMVGMELNVTDEGFVVKDISKEASASKLGVAVGDTVVSIGGLKGDALTIDAIGQEINYGDGSPIALSVLRDGKGLDFKDVMLSLSSEPDSQKFRIGAIVEPAVKTQKVYPSPIAQLKNVLSKTWTTLKALTAKGTKVKAKHMSGPIGIARALGITVSHGIMYGLELVVFISFSLALMNLLPLPVLDGGHITFATLEMVLMRKLPIKFMRAIETAFVVLLLSFMLFVSFYDVLRLTNGNEPEVVTTVKI